MQTRRLKREGTLPRSSVAGTTFFGIRHLQIRARRGPDLFLVGVVSDATVAGASNANTDNGIHW